MTVALFDRATPPIDKACGEGVMPHGVAALRRLGVCPDQDCGRPFVGVRYVESRPAGGPLVAEARFPEGTGLGVRRLQLQLGLARRAEQVGVELHWGEAVHGVTHRGIDTEAGRLEARWIVGADGLHSKVRRWAGLEGRPFPGRRFGVRRHYAVETWTDMVEVHWGDRADAYVTPVCGGSSASPSWRRRAACTATSCCAAFLCSPRGSRGRGRSPRSAARGRSGSG